jgi:hypothetical protein
MSQQDEQQFLDILGNPFDSGRARMLSQRDEYKQYDGLQRGSNAISPFVNA